MARVTAAEVKAFINTTLTDPQIEVWIEVAHSIVNSKADCINGDETLLTQIELQLTCHLITIQNPASGGMQITKQKAEGLETMYASQKEISESINTSVYGTAANALSGGCLATYDKAKATVEFF